MKYQIRQLDGKRAEWKPKTAPRNKSSKLHVRARELLVELFPVHQIYEEVNIPISRNKYAFADFFIPSQFLIIEVQGQQHYSYGFFHKNKEDFIKSQARDRKKKEWAELNNFRLVELPYDESREQWSNRITETDS